MARITYVEKDFSNASIATIAQANAIIQEYQDQGFDLTLRQLYYQFVARGLIANKQTEYKRLGTIVNDGRLAGMIDWDSITDRTRNLQTVPHWGTPADIVDACARQYRVDKWKHQPYRLEVWIEKEALAGVFQRICERLDVPFFSCRGYTSQSEMWAASQRLLEYEIDAEQDTHILHFGDLDPSGVDMTRDIQERLQLFGASTTVHRLALNMDQVEQYNPPPNPAKLTDSRFGGFQEVYGDQSWELDALEPQVLAEMVERFVAEYRDEGAWSVDQGRETEHRKLLRAASDQWEDVTRFLKSGPLWED